ncbi:enoyl-[acyl-carrier-protein] reductase, mitochondrial-like [Patiria miniata]|uniref:Enoyl-[acyl-carrier-protein] reductase, mitochondrial n=1 Tax=Patiria miniata TaxID=46514 RepID=A0A914A2T6_PATMI|nr:enoyl-[acyl-carrier-protein] reductase, mitochondrial-like [Patiria miniata]XP_038057692.1 enoyl-[acyl-carrier-protein] reductase, mitochondrial-like [Patiria miniata]XP_038057693.1 enoyl-[acyl-carrier-protein] reductase, mitochondrial-like [Patiria miniata]
MSAPMTVFRGLLTPLKTSRYCSFAIINETKRCYCYNGKVRALVYAEYGDPVKVMKLSETDLAPLESNSVKIKMLASPINPSDINTIQGIYPIKPQLPCVGGFEGVGEVTEVGGQVTEVKPGDRVIPAVGTLGTWRSHLVCPVNHVMSVPLDTPPLIAATLKVNNCTAFRMLADFVELQPGDSVIQNAANSGAGQAVIQIAAARGLKTINIVRDRPNLDGLISHLQDLGATAVVTEESLRGHDANILKEMPKPKLALNAVGGKSAIITLVKALDDCGTVVTYGGMSKQPVMVPTGSLIFNDLKFVGYWMTRWHDRNAGSEEAKRMITQICQWGVSGQLRAPQHRLVPLSDYASAFEAAQQPYTSQKQILTFEE